MQKLGVFKGIAWILKTKISKHFIPYYIQKNNIDMKPFAGQEYDSFAAFFVLDLQICKKSKSNFKWSYL